jgi:hypothetical protein
VRQKNEEDQPHSLFFCLTFFCLVAERMIKTQIRARLRSNRIQLEAMELR